MEPCYHMCESLMLPQDHSIGADLCLLGGAGSGKSLLAQVFASSLGYDVEEVQLYRDMTSRDLCLSRTTDGRGNTGWQLSPVVTAAMNGTPHLRLHGFACLLSIVLSLEQHTVWKQTVTWL